MNRSFESLTLGKAIILPLLCCLLSACGSSWRLHDEMTLQIGAPSDEAAPDWVKGKVPMDPERIYFVGRSATPDMSRRGDTFNNDASTRVGYTMLDERSALQSARNDVYDQMRQRLAPRSAGTLGQLMVVNVDAGTGKLNGSVDGPLRTSISACNPTCNEHGFDSQTGAEVVCAKSCEDDCKSCGGLRYGLDGRWQKEDGDVDDRLDSDLLQMNVAFDTVTAGMAAYLQQEDAYFEKVLVHDADDFMGRPFAQGNDEWSSWKAWVLMSIPKGEWDTMVNNMRSTHQQMLEMGTMMSMEDRKRRLDFEMSQIQLQQKREEEDRKFDFEQQRLLIPYEMEVDRERTTLPGRRFKITG